MTENNWITWHGGECPVPVGAIGDVKFEDGQIVRGYDLASVFWKHNGFSSDIIAYRLDEAPTEGSSGHGATEFEIGRLQDCCADYRSQIAALEAKLATDWEAVRIQAAIAVEAQLLNQYLTEIRLSEWPDGVETIMAQTAMKFADAFIAALKGGEK